MCESWYVRKPRGGGAGDVPEDEWDAPLGKGVRGEADAPGIPLGPPPPLWSLSGRERGRDWSICGPVLLTSVTPENQQATAQGR